jgi:2,4-dienoyl-CoA reductase-like NADH-dependent reductase (Old Yellow Enzyme family)
MNLQRIDDFKTAFVESVKRAIKAGFDVVEVYAAHRFLTHQFLSPFSNRQTDEYDRSWDIRTKLLL